MVTRIYKCSEVREILIESKNKHMQNDNANKIYMTRALWVTQRHIIGRTDDMLMLDVDEICAMIC